MHVHWENISGIIKWVSVIFYMITEVRHMFWNSQTEVLVINATIKSFLFKNTSMVEFCFRDVAQPFKNGYTACVYPSQNILSPVHKVTTAPECAAHKW